MRKKKRRKQRKQRKKKKRNKMMKLKRMAMEQMKREKDTNKENQSVSDVFASIVDDIDAEIDEKNKLRNDNKTSQGNKAEIDSSEFQAYFDKFMVENSANYRTDDEDIDDSDDSDISSMDDDI